MTVRQIDKDQWKAFFDSLTRDLGGKRAEIEVASLDLGDQIEARWTPLNGLAYDPKDDLIEVALEGVDHLVRKPREVYVDFDVGGLIALEVVDASGIRQIVKLKDPLALPAPAQADAAEQRQ